MASKKVISVNESSLVDLKAELYRKETQLKREKVDNSQPKKAPIWQKKKKESKRKDGKTVVENTTSADNSYDKELEKSRVMLEAKSALYNKLSNGEIEVPSDEDEQEGRFLVDFHQKTFPKVDSEDNNISDNPSEEIPPAASPDEEWVDYVDSFGRSRKCLRKDLPQMKEKDKMKSLEERKQTLLSDDMRRELIRKKWEQEVQEALDKPVGPVHYQDVFFDETRDHGVGFYKFSKVEEERKEQQTALNKMRVQTEQQRSKREKLLEKRKAAMDARLAKIRARKQRKLHEEGAEEHGERTEEHEQGTEHKTEDISSGSIDKTKNDESEEMIGAMVERIRNQSTKIQHKNEWERGKVDLEIFDKPKQSSYDPRSERNPEFAPPSLYTNEKKSFAKKTKRNEKTANVEIPNESGKSEFDNEVTSPSVTQAQCMYSNYTNCSQYDSSSVTMAHDMYSNYTNCSQYDSSSMTMVQDMYSNYTNCSSTEWTVPPQTSVNQNYQPRFDNTLPNDHNTNSHMHVHNTLPNVQHTVPNTSPSLHNTLPNLPPPPIHTFPPPNLPIHTFPPPNLPPPLSYQNQFQPQYPPNIPYPPNYPPPLFDNQQYPNVPQ